MEIWDMYDENRKSLNKTHARGVPTNEGEYHTVVSIWVVNDNNELLITKRDPRKEFGLLWENTAGSVLAGETSLQGARRELFEETGIRIEEDELVFLDTLKETSCFTDNYIVRKNIDITKITLQEGETVNVRIINLDELYKMMENNQFASPVVDRLLYIKDKFERFIKS